MGMKGNNIGQRIALPFKGGVAIAPEDCNNETVEGTAIVEPWNYGRQIAFQALHGVIHNSAVLSWKIQGRLRADGTTWEDIQNNADPAADLEFDTVDEATIDGLGIFGSLDLSTIDGETYEAIRLIVVNGAAQSALVGASYFIYDLYRHPSDTDDQLSDKQA